MKVVFRSIDFASVEYAGFGFSTRRPGATPWSYQGRVQNARWSGTYVCHWNNRNDDGSLKRAPAELIWTIQGDERLFSLAAALKSAGFTPEVEQDTSASSNGPGVLDKDK